MKKTNRRKAGAAAAAFCLGLPAALGVITGTSAYMTDHAEKVNRITVGWNTTEIEEEFPSPTPAAPGDTVAKKRSGSGTPVRFPAISVRLCW